MDVTGELEQLLHAAAPEVVLAGCRMREQVSDVLQREVGMVEALVVGDDAPHVVRMPERSALHGATCTCGQTSPCTHVIAARLSVLQQFGGVSDAHLHRWRKRVVARRTLSSAWDGLATVWLEAVAAGDPHPSEEVILDAGSLHGGLQVALALIPCATHEQLSRFLVDLGHWCDIAGRTALPTHRILDADEIATFVWRSVVPERPEAGGAVLLNLAGSLRRTVTVPEQSWRAQSALQLTWHELGRLLVGGMSDPSLVADALVNAELQGPESDHPWMAMMFRLLGDGAQPVAREMQRSLDPTAAEAVVSADGGPRHRLRAEVGLASEGVSGVQPVLETWPDAPYGEFLCRLPPTWVPEPRVRLLESARRMGRLRWAPGWPQHTPHAGSGRPAHLERALMPHHPMWGDIAVGDLVLAVAQMGRVEEARAMLLEHARRHPGPTHRHEFARIWSAARLGERADEQARSIFIGASEDLGAILAEISRIPEKFFWCDLTVARRGVGSALLTAILLEDIPGEGHAHYLDAPVRVHSFFRAFPAAADDIDALAAVPPEAVADKLEDAVGDRDLAVRVHHVASQVVAAGASSASTAPADSGERLITALDQTPAAGALTTGLVALILQGRCAREPERVLRQLVRRATGGAVAYCAGVFERAYAAEPRGEDVTAYLLAIVLAERDGHLRAQHLVL